MSNKNLIKELLNSITVDENLTNAIETLKSDGTAIITVSVTKKNSLGVIPIDLTIGDGKIAVQTAGNTKHIVSDDTLSAAFIDLMEKARNSNTIHKNTVYQNIGKSLQE